MAPVDKSFPHITVQADDDDDFVIQAGICRKNGQEPYSEPDERAAVGSIDEVQADTCFEGESEKHCSSDDESKAVRRRASEGYRETTAEDLKAEPMPAMQKAVIAVALLFIAGCIVYYIFMR